MARTIYEIKLKDRFIPALSEADALDLYKNGESGLSEDDVEVNPYVTQEHTMKLFILAKTMADTEKFTSDEIEAALRSLAIGMGYYNYVAVAKCALTWVEKFDDLTLSDLEEWIIG